MHLNSRRLRHFRAFQKQVRAIPFRVYAALVQNSNTLWAKTRDLVEAPEILVEAPECFWLIRHELTSWSTRAAETRRGFPRFIYLLRKELKWNFSE